MTKPYHRDNDVNGPFGTVLKCRLEELSAGGNLFELLQSLWLMWQASAVIVAGLCVKFFF